MAGYDDPTPKPADLNTRRLRTFPAIIGHSRECEQPATAEHDEDVMQMNKVRLRASGWVQRAVIKVECMISEPGHPTGDERSLQEETIMLKTISAALLAVSVIAAPVLAAAPDKTAQAPATKTTQAPVKKTAQAPVIKAGQAKSKVLNANARMGHKHYRHHKHMGMLKTHVTPKVVTKHVTPSAKRG